MTAAIRLTDVTVRFGERLVLDRVNLTVAERDFMALIGPNGGGKSTLLKVVLGLVEPSEGQVEVLAGAPREARGRVGYVPQYLRFDTEFPVSVRQVVEMGRLGKPRDRRPVDAALADLEITDLAARQVGKLSGGQLQRVLIARALAVEPALLLLDEPTASLDTHSASGFYELVSRLSEQLTVVMVSHDVGAVSRYVRSIACLAQRLYAHGATLDEAVVEQAYGCPVDLIAHGTPHRVLGAHHHSGGGSP
ncbi:MAG: metal ABC transporter ATP-binding protein [Sorangiineae bacterium]|nr:metal ABC transporter ATP-binding protein [Polyangiaceae bacterium]MEB2322143.1 metal ABC transporter ATP-binding protein [Sorangiineae bacterium]